MKYLLTPACALLLTACGGDSSSDGKASTYDTCRITDSAALFASDRANDLAQCWTITSTSNQQNAQAQCSTLVSSYIASEYLFGHAVEYAVSSSSCP